MTKRGAAQWAKVSPGGEMEKAADAELAQWRGVTWTRERRGKHPVLILTAGGVSRLVVYAGTSGDSLRGARNHVRDIRGALRDLGAERVEAGKRTPATRKAPARQAVVTHDLRRRAEPLRADPSRDPWLQLATLDLRPRRGSTAWWRRLWARALTESPHPTGATQ